ncbi:MAG: PfkB family carbohydrate kinase, partial [Endomicrobia bacterium]|nr:PfkB family carbohydrate kinase [Endomicrobiia bacterium]
MDKEKLYSIIKKFDGKKILVVGDIMLDKYIWGNVERISPEAPVPVVEVVKETQNLGGCGNVADNIVAVGGKAFIVTIVGNDQYGEELKFVMRQRGIDVSGVFVDETRPTTVKTRIIAHNQQVVRVDKESRTQITSAIFEKIKMFVNEVKQQIDGILISDYGKGVITRGVLSFLINTAQKLDIPISVDPK